MILKSTEFLAPFPDDPSFSPIGGTGLLIRRFIEGAPRLSWIGNGSFSEDVSILYLAKVSCTASAASGKWDSLCFWQLAVVRLGYLIFGLLALVLGAVGAFVPLLPTVPFVILAAFCFARSSPRLEQWLVGHERFGVHIAAWRSRGAISSAGKRAALLAFGASAVAGLALLPLPWALIPTVAALIGGSWILSRPSA